MQAQYQFKCLQQNPNPNTLINGVSFVTIVGGSLLTATQVEFSNWHFNYFGTKSKLFDDLLKKEGSFLFGFYGHFSRVLTILRVDNTKLIHD